MLFKWLDFKITNRCNNNCAYCGGHNDPPSAREMIPFSAIENTLTDALEANFSYICFLGGEPSIREDIEEVIKVVGNAPQVHLRVITNLKRFRKSMYEELFSTESCDAEVVASFENFQTPNYKRVDAKTSMGRIDKIHEMAQEFQSDLSDPGKTRSVSIHSVI